MCSLSNGIGSGLTKEVHLYVNGKCEFPIGVKLIDLFLVSTLFCQIQVKCNLIFEQYNRILSVVIILLSLLLLVRRMKLCAKLRHQHRST